MPTNPLLPPGLTGVRRLCAFAFLLAPACAAPAQSLLLGVSEGTSGGLDHARAVAKYQGLADVIGRARARFGDVPEVRMLVARLQLRGDAFVEAEETLAPLTNDADHSRASCAWAWIAVSRKARGDAKGAKQAAEEALALDSKNAVALRTK